MDGSKGFHFAINFIWKVASCDLKNSVTQYQWRQTQLTALDCRLVVDRSKNSGAGFIFFRKFR